jgi:hypothetical protein
MPEDSYFHHHSGREHYRLLMYLSQQFDNVDFIELGIHRGASSLSLSTNKNNQVYCFDIKPTIPEILKNLGFDDIKNIHSTIIDVLKTDQYNEKILNSALIFLDTNHDGIFETNFYNFLVKNNYSGILMMDDIHHEEYPELREVWNKTITHSKIDITKYGHWSGTGLVMFNKNIEIIQR